MRGRDPGFPDYEMQIATPAFCMDLTAWNEEVKRQVASHNLRQTRYRLFLVLPPDFHEKAGGGVLVRRDDGFGAYHIMERTYYGATRKFVMESMVQEGWTPQSPQDEESSPTSLQLYADDPVMQGLQGPSPPFMSW